MQRDWFLDDAIDPELERFNAGVEKVLDEAPRLDTQEPAEIRAARARGEGAFGPVVTVDEARDREIPGPAGPLRVRTIVPDEVRGVYLHIHGGGWALGAPEQSDVANLRLAQRCGLAVASVDYRLAPEHPYPAGNDDCEAAALWLVENAAREWGSERLLIGGDSAGAHLSATTLLRMRDRHGYAGFAAANLVFGCFDLGLTPSVRRWGERNLILNTPIIEWFADMYVAPARRGEPDVSPLHADLAGLPPALFSVGTLDPLLDDSLFMHGRWLAAGNEAELAVYPGGIHGFTAFPLAIAARAAERVEAFLGART